jgi:hypothetical protein
MGTMENVKTPIEFARVKQLSVAIFIASVICMGLAAAGIATGEGLGLVGFCLLALSVGLLLAVSRPRSIPAQNDTWAPAWKEVLGMIVGAVIYAAAGFAILWAFIALVKWMWIHS